MSEAMWVWDYELKTLGSWPSTGYNGHNTPVEVVTQMDVKTLRDERDRIRAALEVAGDDICSEFCGAGPCHKKCLAVQAALTPAGGGQK